MIISPFTLNTPPGKFRPAKLEKYISRSKYKEFRSLGKASNNSAYYQANDVNYTSKKGNFNIDTRKKVNNSNINNTRSYCYNNYSDNYNPNNKNNSNNIKSIVYLDSHNINHFNESSGSALNSRLLNKPALFKKAYMDARVCPRPDLSHITSPDRTGKVKPSKVYKNCVNIEKVISNKSCSKKNYNSTMSTSSTITDKRPRASWIIMDDDCEKMNASPPPTISLTERFANLPMNKDKRKKGNNKKKKKRRRRGSIPSNTWITINKSKDQKESKYTKRRVPRIEDDDEDDDEDQLASNKVPDDSLSHLELCSNGLNENVDNSASVRSEPSLLDELDIITAEIDDNLLVDCMLTDWNDMEFILNVNDFDLSNIEQSMQSE